MKLKDLIPCDYDMEIEKITDDSRTKGTNILFVCVKGLTVDGHNFIDKAIENGAVCILASREVKASVPVIVVEDTVRTMNECLDKFYGKPTDRMKLLAVTGTDGKTTTSEIMYKLLNDFGKRPGYIGTNGIRSANYTQDNDYTTPLQEDLFKALDGFNKDKVDYVSMEASGERLGTGKMEGVMFDASIFTNLTRDALDIFKTMENYGAAKARLMSYTRKDGICVINADDPYKELFINAANAKVVTYGVEKPADVYAKNIDVKYSHLEFDMEGILGKHHIICGLSGIFNVYNLMAVTVVLNHLGFLTEDIVDAIKRLTPVEARQTLVDHGQPFRVIVDYAHTANAVKNLVEYIRSTMTVGKLKIVVGAGGSRDKYRRTDMAEYCTKNADYNYFTIEDARFEDPEMLVETMVETVRDSYSNYELIVDRDEAITKAIFDAEDGDTILILGKGAEDYLSTMGKAVPRLNDIDRSDVALDAAGYYN